MKCFHCNRDIPAIRTGRCTYCGAPIPADQLPSPEQLANIDELDKQQEEHHTATMKVINSIQPMPSSPNAKFDEFEGICND